jgi:hypothetical protein
MTLTEDQVFAISDAIGAYIKRDPEILREYKTYWRLQGLDRPLTNYEEAVKRAVSSTLDLFYDKYNAPEEKKAHAKVEELMKMRLSQEDAVAQVVKSYNDSSYNYADEDDGKE